MTALSRKALAAATLLSAVSGFAQATTVTFSPLTGPNQGPAGDGVTYIEGGLTFMSSAVSWDALFHWGASESFNADPGGATLFQNWPGQGFTATRTDSGPFSLSSIDVADVYNVGTPASFMFVYLDLNGPHYSTKTLDSTVGLQTFTFNYPNIYYFAVFNIAPNWVQIDNVVVGVPEPASYALTIAGLLAVLGATRRRGDAAG